MLKRASSFAPMVAFIFLAAATAVGTHGLALANGECIENPDQHAAKGARWYHRYDSAKGRKCWFLAESSTNAGDAGTPQSRANAAPTPTFSSRLAVLLGLKGSTATAARQKNLPQKNSTSEQRTFQSKAASGPKAGNSVRIGPSDLAPDTAEERSGKRYAPNQVERDALFEEFLRWRESQQGVDGIRPTQSP